MAKSAYHVSAIWCCTYISKIFTSLSSPDVFRWAVRNQIQCGNKHHSKQRQPTLSLHLVAHRYVIFLFFYFSPVIVGCSQSLLLAIFSLFRVLRFSHIFTEHFSRSVVIFVFQWRKHIHSFISLSLALLPVRRHILRYDLFAFAHNFFGRLFFFPMSLCHSSRQWHPYFKHLFFFHNEKKKKNI